jgi:hypothetical protein
MVGGKETGQKMMDYIIPNAAFVTAYAKLAATGWKLNLQSAHRPGAKGGTKSKTKFTCPACGQNAWGKPDLEIICKPCGADMLAPAPPVEFAPELAPSYEPTSLSYDTISPAPAEAEPAKRKPGRPKGSKNQPKRGRPKAPGTVSAKPHGEERDSSKARLNH